MNPTETSGGSRPASAISAQRSSARTSVPARSKQTCEGGVRGGVGGVQGRGIGESPGVGESWRDADGAWGNTPDVLIMQVFRSAQTWLVYI